MATSWHPLAVRLLYLFLRPFMQRRLAGIYVQGLPTALPAGHTVLLVANHVSWWDGFLLREVHQHCVGDHPLYTVMLEAQLRRFPFFRWMGALGITPSEPASLRRALRFLQAQRQEADNPWVAFFPQGRIWPSWRRPLAFQPGLRLFAEALKPAVLLPVGLHIEPLNEARPAAFVSVGPPRLCGENVVQMAEEGVTEALNQIHDLLRTYGEDTPKHWPRA